jgi:hypothetical protein
MNIRIRNYSDALQEAQCPIADHLEKHFNVAQSLCACLNERMESLKMFHLYQHLVLGLGRRPVGMLMSLAIVE